MSQFFFIYCRLHQSEIPNALPDSEGSVFASIKWILCSARVNIPYQVYFQCLIDDQSCWSQSVPVQAWKQFHFHSSLPHEFSPKNQSNMKKMITYIVIMH